MHGQCQWKTFITLHIMVFPKKNQILHYFPDRTGQWSPCNIRDLPSVRVKVSYLIVLYTIISLISRFSAELGSKSPSVCKFGVSICRDSDIPVAGQRWKLCNCHVQRSQLSVFQYGRFYWGSELDRGWPRASRMGYPSCCVWEIWLLWLVM